MIDLLYWGGYWFTVWGIFNLSIYLSKGRFTFIACPLYVRLYFLIASLPLLFLFPSAQVSIALLLIASLTFLFLIRLLPESNRSLSRTLTIDILFQQLMVNLLFNISQIFLPDAFNLFSGFSPGLFSALIFVLSFTLGHLPIIFLPHVTPKGKFLLLFAALCGSLLMNLTFIIFPQPFSAIISFLIHICFYLFLNKYDLKYSLHIINF